MNPSGTSLPNFIQCLTSERKERAQECSIAKHLP